MPTNKKHLTKAQLAKKLKNIKILVLDVDGVLTDDLLYVGPEGFELKRFHIGDGLAIVLARRVGLETIIVSNRYSPATETRMKDLRIEHVIQERGDKLRIFKNYIKSHRLEIKLSEVAYIGNDIMDISLAQAAALGIAVNDANPELRRAVDFVTANKGGHGAVREIIELYFKSRKIDATGLLRK